MITETFWSKLKRLVNENPVKFVGVVQAVLAFAVVIASTAGVVIPASIVAGFIGTLTAVLTWWTQNNKTVTNAKYEAAVAGIPCEDDKVATEFAGFSPDGSSIGVDGQ